MRSLTTLAFTAALSLTTTLAGAQQKPVPRAAAQVTTHATLPAPAITADSAKSIALAHVRGATVTSEKLQARKGERYYLFTLRESNHRALVRATVDAMSGRFSRLDKAPQK